MSKLSFVARGRGVLAAILCVTLVVIVGCAATRLSGPSDRSLRAPSDLPDHFLVGEHDGGATSEPTPAMGCRNPMVDPRDGTRIKLVRSSSGHGDYEVSPGKYGVGENEILRIDCGTGRSIGIFRRQKGA